MNCECNKGHEVERIYLVPFYCITLRNMLNEKIDINYNADYIGNIYNTDYIYNSF